MLTPETISLKGQNSSFVWPPNVFCFIVIEVSGYGCLSLTKRKCHILIEDPVPVPPYDFELIM